MAIVCKIKFAPKEPRILKESEWRKEYQSAAIGATRLAGIRLANEVMRAMPSATGTTRRSVGLDVAIEGERIVGIIGSPKKEAYFIEYGTGPQHQGESGATRAYFPPIKRLLIWAKRIVGDERFAYYLQRKIRGLIPGKLGGTPAFRPFRLTVQRYGDEAVRIYERAYATLTNRMSS